MSGIKDRVAIIGMGCTKFGERWDMGAEDLIIEAFTEAIRDAEIERGDIEAAWVGEAASGTSGVTLSIPLKLQSIPVTRVENACATGTDAVRNAAFAVAAGAYDIVLVMGFEKLKDSGLRGLPNPASSPYGGLGLYHPVMGSTHTAPGNFALVGTRYFYHYGLTPAEGKMLLAKIAVKNHHNGAMHPKAHLQREVTLEQVINAPMIAYPLGLFDCCPTTDGAAAAIIATPETARKLKGDQHIMIKGIGVAAGVGTGRVRTDYDYLHFDETVSAAKQAYEEAQIKDPFKELSLAEVHDCFTSTELVTYEDLGLCARGAAKEYINNGTFELSGEMPVNSDGGLKSFGHPIGASGIRMIYEIYNQVLGRAGEKRQLKDPQIGLTHNIGGGPGAAVCSVGIFGR